MKSLSVVLLVLILAPGSAFGQTAYPMLMSARPIAAQRGTTTEVTLRSRYSMYGAYRVLVSGSGVQGQVVPHAVAADQKVPNLTNLKVRLTVAKDAPTGVRDIRVATPRGVSTVGQFVVVNDPIAIEKSKDNNAFEKAEAIPIPATVCGAIERAEDVDYFRFHAEAGESLCFHVRCMRLQDRIHDLQQHADPLITLRAANGATLATADNSFFADPLLAHRFEAAGDYVLEIRDVRYQGNAYWEYCIEVTDQPLVTAVHPLGIGQPDPEVQFVGYNLTETAGRLTGDVSRRGFGHFAVDTTQADVRVPVVISDLPLVQETAEPNDELAAAQSVTVPAGISGRLEAPEDIDCYSFKAKKGEAFSFEVVARRCQSAVDSLIQITDVEGRVLLEHDDMRLYKHTFADSWIENWTAPADGDYRLRIRDLHLRGGDEYVYFIRATRPQPDFDLYLDTDKTQLTPGTSGVLFANVVRRNGFDGEVRLRVDNLPPGVTASPGRILAGQRDGCVILTAAKDAKPEVAEISVSGSAVHGERELTTIAVPYQETYQPGGGRGHWPVESHVVCVAETADLLGVKISPAEIVLKPGESKRVDIEIERAPGFTKNVQLDALFRHLSTTYADTLPAGVTVDSGNSRTLLTGSATKGHITFKAAGNARAAKQQQVAIMANISLNFVMKWTYSSSPLRVSVEP